MMQQLLANQAKTDKREAIGEATQEVLLGKMEVAQEELMKMMVTGQKEKSAC
jgi:hypothetical protein